MYFCLEAGQRVYLSGNMSPCLHVCLSVWKQAGLTICLEIGRRIYLNFLSDGCTVTARLYWWTQPAIVVTGAMEHCLLWSKGDLLS